MTLLLEKMIFWGRSSPKSIMHTKFYIKDFGQVKCFLGVEVTRKKKGIFLSQRKYVLDLLVKTGKSTDKPCNTTMVPHVHLTREDGSPFDDPERYRRLVGKLNYLSVTHPDIDFAMNIFFQFMSAPRIKHRETLEKILCYLKISPRLCILYGTHKHSHIECFANAYRASYKTNTRSTIGFYVFVGGNLVS